MKTEASERLTRLGASALSDAELFSLLGVKRLPDFGARPFETLHQTPVADLAREIGETYACRTLAALELGRRAAVAQTPKTRMDSPEAAAAYLTPRHAHHAGEVFGILALDSKHRLLGEKIVATGGRHMVAVAPADVFSAALPFRPRSVAVFHNHPSGDPFPSEEDKALTYRLARSGEVLGIAVVDHIVLGGFGFASFKQMGLL